MWRALTTEAKAEYVRNAYYYTLCSPCTNGTGEFLRGHQPVLLSTAEDQAAMNAAEARRPKAHMICTKCTRDMTRAMKDRSNVKGGKDDKKSRGGKDDKKSKGTPKKIIAK